MKSSIGVCSALLLAAVPVFAIPPESFGFPSAPNHTTLSVSFMHNGVRENVREGILFGFGITENAPTLAVNTSMYQSLNDYKGQYVALMVDPDASTPQNPSLRFILHYMAANLTASNTTSPTTAGSDGAAPRVLSSNSDPIVPYARPMPPTTSDPHRYIFYLFEQPDNFAVPPAYSGYSAMNRTMFNLTNFVADASLGMPAAANYFFVSHQQAVPDDFVGEPGSMYPGGNGGAITVGPGPTPTPMSSSMGGSMSSSMGASMSGGSMTSSMGSGMASKTSSTGAAASETLATNAAANNGRTGAAGLAAAFGAAVFLGA